MFIYYLEHILGNKLYSRIGQGILIMVAVCVIGSADTAKCADCIGGSMYRRVGDTLS